MYAIHESMLLGASANNGMVCHCYTHCHTTLNDVSNVGCWVIGYSYSSSVLHNRENTIMTMTRKIAP